MKTEQIMALLAATKALLNRDQQKTCQHEDTHRGGAIWEICDSCDRKWSDDRDPKPEWKDPPEWEAAHAAIDAIEAALKEREGVTTDDVVSGALFDFMGYLTTREERLTLSACDEAGPAVEAIQAFADKRGLSLDEANVEGWKAHTEPPKAQPMSDALNLAANRLHSLALDKEFGTAARFEVAEWADEARKAAHGIGE